MHTSQASRLQEGLATRNDKQLDCLDDTTRILTASESLEEGLLSAA